MHFSVICTIHPVINTSEVVAPSVAPSVGLKEQLGVWNSAHHFDVLVYRTWMLQTGQQELIKKCFSFPGQQVVAYLSRYDIKDDCKQVRQRVSACVTHSSHSRGGAMMSLFTQCGLRGDGEGGPNSSRRLLFKGKTWL